MLLYGGACRIQDVVGMPYNKITEAIPDEDGFIVLKLEAKKTAARSVMINPEEVEAVEAYQRQEDAPHDAVIFTSEGAVTSSNTLLRWLTRFYKKHGKTVQSHDFRATSITHYNADNGNDVNATMLMVGHSDVRNT